MKLTPGPARVRHHGGHRLKLTPVLGPVEGPGRETDARVRHQGRRLKLTIVLGPVEGPGA